MKNGIVINANDCAECPRQSVTGFLYCALCIIMNGLHAFTGYSDEVEAA